jgi:hypothetical protein
LLPEEVSVTNSSSSVQIAPVKAGNGHANAGTRQMGGKIENFAFARSLDK